MNRRGFFRSVAAAAVVAPAMSTEAAPAPAITPGEPFSVAFDWDAFTEDVRGQWSAEQVRLRYLDGRPVVTP